MSPNLPINDYTIAQQQALVKVNAKTQLANGSNRTLTEIKSEVLDTKTTLESKVNGMSPRLDNVNVAIPNKVIEFGALIAEEETLYQSISQVATTKFTMTLDGSVEKFYPVWFKFNSETINFLEIYRNKNLNSELFVLDKTIPSGYIYIEGCGYDPLTELPGRLTVRSFNEIGNKCMSLPSPNLYSSREINSEKGYYTVGISGIYLRGGLTYNFRCNDLDVIHNIETIFNDGTKDAYTITGVDGEEYYAEATTVEDCDKIDWDASISPLYGTQQQP